jgi:hypothetical protein
MIAQTIHNAMDRIIPADEHNRLLRVGPERAIINPPLLEKNLHTTRLVESRRLGKPSGACLKWKGGWSGLIRD